MIRIMVAEIIFIVVATHAPVGTSFDHGCTESKLVRCEFRLNLESREDHVSIHGATSCVSGLDNAA